jgi:hypothetical protein
VPHLVPTRNEILSAGVLALGEARPTALRHLPAGRWGDVLKGWWAQYAVVRARLASEVTAARHGTAAGEELRDLAESQLWRLIPDEPSKAIGEAVLVRTVTNSSSSVSGSFSAGVFPVGFRLSKDVVETELSPEQEPAEYVTTAAVYADRADTTTTGLGGGQFLHSQTVTLPIEASREGPHANVCYVPADSENGLGALLDAPFDTTFTVSSLRAAGGTMLRSETQLRTLARQGWQGSKGPNASALVVGALLQPGVHRAVHALDPDAAVAALFVADESWATSAAFRASVNRSLVDNDWLGFGARVDVRGVQVRSVSVEVDATVRSVAAMLAASDIETAIGAALRDAFEGDLWYSWTTDGLRGAVAAADRRIVSVEDVRVLHAGVEDAEPALALDPTATELTHWHMRKNGLRVSLEV